MSTIEQTNHPQTHTISTFSVIPLPILTNNFKAEVRCKKFKNEPFDYHTIQIINVKIINNKTLQMELECDTGGKVIEEYQKLRNQRFDLDISNLDGTDTVFYKECFKGCKIKNTSWDHDYADCKTVKLKMEVTFKKLIFEMVTPKELRYDKTLLDSYKIKLDNSDS